MKYALVNDTKTEATKGVKGVCPICNSELIAKCGERKVNHWAHKGTRNCDPWWEPETEWHRNWKDNYPSEWQEISLPDEETGEKHIADVRTVHKLVIEFQHSPIKPEERISREKFYKNMVWVVDGTRLKRDFPRFLKGTKSFRKTNVQGVFFIDFPEEVFPPDWLNSSVPVIFDFFDIFVMEQQDTLKNSLWVLLPQGIHLPQGMKNCTLVRMSREDFIKITHNREQLFPENKTQHQITLPRQPQIQIKRREPTHFLHKGKWVKRRRL